MYATSPWLRKGITLPDIGLGPSFCILPKKGKPRYGRSHRQNKEYDLKSSPKLRLGLVKHLVISSIRACSCYRGNKSLGVGRAKRLKRCLELWLACRIQRVSRTPYAT